MSMNKTWTFVEGFIETNKMMIVKAGFNKVVLESPQTSCSSDRKKETDVSKIFLHKKSGSSAPLSHFLIMAII